MATFEAQVAGLTSLTIDDSSSPTRAELNQFLTDGAKEVINQLPGHLLPLCAASQTFTSGSADTLTTGKILNVFRSDGDINQPCRKIPAKQKGRVSDPEEMSYATITDPVFFIDNNTLDVLPSGGSCSYSAVEYPTVSYTASAITAFPNEAEHLVALYGAVKSIQNVLGNLSDTIDSDTRFISFEDFFNLTEDGNPFGDNDPGVFSVSEVPPTPPSAPSYTSPDVSSVSISNVGVPPTYTAPTVAGATEALTATITDGTIGTDADFQDFSDWWEVLGHMIEDEEDTELASAQVQKISTYLRAYQEAMTNNLNTYNKENVAYQAKLQEAIQQAQINSQKAQQDSSLTLQKEQQEYQSNLSKFSNEVQSYQAKVNKEVQEYGQKFTKYQFEVNTAFQSWSKTESDSLAQYNVDVQNELNEFNKENVAYQGKLQESIQQAQITSQAAQQQAQIDSQDAQKETELTLSKEVQEYQAKLSKYSAEVQTYQANVSKEVQQYSNNLTADIQAYQQKIAKYSNEIQSYQAEVSSKINNYNAQIQKQNTDYQWLAGRYTQLSANYESGLQKLRGH